MKRIAFLLAVFCFLFPTSSLKAQVGEYRSVLAVGANGGYALNKVSFDPSVKQFYHGGLTGGLTLRYTCEKYFSMLCALQAEVNYAQLGWKENIETSTDTYSRTATYVQVPLLARLGFGRELKGAMGYLILGPQVGFCLGDSDERTGDWNESTLALRPKQVTAQYDLPVERKFEYGITGGLGLEVNTRHAGHFMLEGRYYFALSDMFNNGKTDTFGRSANGAIVAKVTYLFDVLKTKR